MKVSRNIIWNVSGASLPLIVGVLVIPEIVKGLGVARFGILSIIWMMIGYFSIFDLGLSRTLTKAAADRIGTPEEQEIPALVSTAAIIVLTCSIIMSMALALCSRFIATEVLHVAPNMVSDVSRAIFWLSVGLPFVLMATVLFGVLEGFHKFGLTSSIRLPLGILMFLVPYGVLHFHNSLSAITATLVIVRVTVLIVLVVAARRVVPALKCNATNFRREHVKPLMTYGGWLTVSNVVGPILVYFDRFLIAAILGTTAIAYYTVPYDTLNRLLIFPTAVQGVLFPAFATLRGQASERIVSVFRRASEKTFLVMAPAVLSVMLLGKWAINGWLGAGFAEQSTIVAKILVIGVLINALARAPFVLVQGYGRAKWTALMHLGEVPFYAGLLWILLTRIGIEGVALAWTARVSIDAAAVYIMAVRLEPKLKSAALRDMSWILVTCAAAGTLGVAIKGLVTSLTIVSVVSIVSAIVLLRDLKSAMSVS